jgi:GR25 family glycosyltransferase involved in LPS biosynthesis
MKVYVINLEEATERKASIIKELDKTDLSYEFVIPIPSSIEVDDSRLGWTNGADSLRLTTINLVEKAIEADEDMIWIWEDDAIIDEEAFSGFVKELPKYINFDFIMLNYERGSRLSIHKTGCLRKIINGTLRCTSYIINKSVYEAYLKELSKEQPIDHATARLHSFRQRSFIVEPKPVCQEVGKHSYIRNKIVNY